MFLILRKVAPEWIKKKEKRTVTINIKFNIDTSIPVCEYYRHVNNIILLFDNGK